MYNIIKVFIYSVIYVLRNFILICQNWFVFNGINVIKDALSAAEEFSSSEEEISVSCFYNGAPEYRIELKAPDFKTAEDLWIEVSNSVVNHITENGGEASAYRE